MVFVLDLLQFLEIGVGRLVGVVSLIPLVSCLGDKQE